jgi:hypothetical protein
LCSFYKNDVYYLPHIESQVTFRGRKDLKPTVWFVTKFSFRIKWCISLPFKWRSVVWCGCQTVSALRFCSSPTDEEEIFCHRVASLGKPTISLEATAVPRLPLKSLTFGFQSFGLTSSYFMLTTARASNMPRCFQTFSWLYMLSQNKLFNGQLHKTYHAARPPHGYVRPMRVFFRSPKYVLMAYSSW